MQDTLKSSSSKLFKRNSRKSNHPQDIHICFLRNYFVYRLLLLYSFTFQRNCSTRTSTQVTANFSFYKRLGLSTDWYNVLMLKRLFRNCSTSQTSSNSITYLSCSLYNFQRMTSRRHCIFYAGST